MYALRNLGDALDVTRRYFGSLGVVGWLQLGVIILLIGGFGIAGQLFNVPFGADSIEGVSDLWVGLVVAGIVFAIYAAFRYLAAVLEFVYVESLRSESIRFRRDIRANLWQGLWLLLFRLALWIALIVTITVLVGGVVVFGAGSEIAELTDGQVAGSILAAIVALVGWSGVFTLTTGFVVPIMHLEDRGPLSAWRRFVSSMLSNWTGVFAFLLVAWVLGLLFWVVFVFVGFFVSLFGFLVIAVLAVVLMELHPSLGVLALVFLLFGYLGYQYVVALIEAPLRSYVRYYALLLLGDTDSTLDLIPEQRGAVRSDVQSGSRSRSTSTEAQSAESDEFEWGTPDTDSPSDQDDSPSETDESTASDGSEDRP